MVRSVLARAALPHLPPRTAGQSLSSLQVPASPEDVSQSPPAPVLPTLNWPLAVESSKIFVIQHSIVTTETGTGTGTGQQEVLQWAGCLTVSYSGTMCWKETNQLSQTRFTYKGLVWQCGGGDMYRDTERQRYTNYEVNKT